MKLLGLLLFSIFCLASLKADPAWRNLLDPKLKDWKVWLGVPHSSQPVEGHEARENVTKPGPAIGFDRELRQIFTTQDEGGEIVLRVSGEIFGSLVTKEDFSDYHLTLQFKWGEKKWAPRMKAKRNSGVLYHSVGTKHHFWNSWLTSLECEIMEKDCGDYISIGPVKATIPSVLVREKRFEFSPDGEKRDFAWNKGFVTGRCYKPGDPEKPHGEWNTMELYCLGSKNVHVLNGKVVMVVENPMYREKGVWKPMMGGKIQLQSEAAELFFKQIRIRPLKAIPDSLGLVK